MVPRHNGIRTERWKLIHYYPFDEWELFDLERDPDETRNLYGDPAYADTTANLAVRLGRLQEAYGDDTVTGPVPEWIEKYR